MNPRQSSRILSGGALLTLVVLLVCGPISLLTAQVVDVTLVLETNRVHVGETTLLNAYAWVVAGRRGNADRIFSWCVDALNSAPAVARVDFGRLLRPVSDNETGLSSGGTPAPAICAGIHDTFMNRPGAGVSEPVLLFTVPVTGLSPGKSTCSVRAGTGVPALAYDFLVAPLDGGDPLTGGNYLRALSHLEVISDTDVPTPFRLALTRPVPSDPARWEIRFPVAEGWDYWLESRPSLEQSASWQLVPGGPFNTGSITLTNRATSSFYRVQAQHAR